MVNKPRINGNCGFGDRLVVGWCQDLGVAYWVYCCNINDEWIIVLWLKTKQFK